jgi:hypothetical protein
MTVRQSSWTRCPVPGRSAAVARRRWPLCMQISLLGGDCRVGRQGERKDGEYLPELLEVQADGEE